MQNEVLAHLGVGFTIIVCVLVPIAAVVYLAVRKRSLMPLFLLGVAGFVIMIVIGVPINQLKVNSGFFHWQLENRLISIFVLAALSVVLEETVRLFLLRTQRSKPYRLGAPLAFGVGFGGIQMIYLVVFSFHLFSPGMLSAESTGVIFMGVERVAAFFLQLALSLVMYVAIMRRMPGLVVAVYAGHFVLAVLPAFISSFVNPVVFMLVCDALVFAGALAWAKRIKPKEGKDVLCEEN